MTAPQQMRVLFKERSVEMWAVGEVAAYHLHIPKLYGRVLPQRCTLKIGKASGKVYLILRKDSDAPWKYLRG